MKFRTLSYYLSEAFKSLFRNRLMTLASILTVASCIFILTFSFSVAANIDHFMDNLEESLNLVAFIDNDIDDTQALQLLSEIENINNIAQVEFVSHEEAFSRAMDMFAEGRELALGLPVTTFPRSFEITMVDVGAYSEVVDALYRIIDEGRGLEWIRYNLPIINTISAINTGIRIVSMLMIIILIVLANVIIVNTIRLTVNARRTEITIMKYIGATDWFIKWPFIIEGMLIGLIGALLPVLIVWIGYNGAIEALAGFIGVMDVEFRPATSIFVIVLPLAIAIGVGIGVYGSVMSMRKHLNV